MSEQRGFTPFDLQPPARLLLPDMHKRRNFRTRTVRLGTGKDAATLEVMTWDKCLSTCTAPASSHEAGRSVQLKVPCDSLPHCHYCECGDSHSFLVADEQVRELLAALS